MTQVNLLENKINTNPTDETIKIYTENKKYIENYNNEKANGAITCTTDEKEKASKFFQDDNLPKLSNRDKESCETLIQYKKLAKLLKI